MKEPLEVFADYLSRKNLKMTPQRRCILDIFLEEKGHHTSEDLYNIVKKVDKSIGQATVYRTLKLLSESGLAKEVNFGDGVTRYEQKYGYSHHDHIICEECGKALAVVDEKIEELQEKLAESHGFVLTHHEMYLYGICADCRSKARENS